MRHHIECFTQEPSVQVPWWMCLCIRLMGGTRIARQVCTSRHTWRDLADALLDKSPTGGSRSAIVEKSIEEYLDNHFKEERLPIPVKPEELKL